MAPKKGEFPMTKALREWYRKRPMTKALREWYAKIGKKGGAKGGHRAALNMTPEQRQARARKAAAARWDKRKKG